MQLNELKEVNNLAPNGVPYINQQFIQNLPIAIYGCDAEGFIRFYNPAAVNLWGREPINGLDQWCGAWKIYSANGNPIELDKSPMAIALKEGKFNPITEMVIERPDGSKRIILPYPQTFRDENGSITGAITSIVDITQQKNDQKIVNGLERSNSELRSFSYIASHDLQEPLRKIITFSDKLKKTPPDELCFDKEEYLNKIIHSAERMRRLIDEVLNFSHVSNSGKEYELTDLNKILLNVLSDFDQRILEKQTLISFSKLPTIQAIPIQMNQLFHNLISNALKFSASDKIPFIQISHSFLSPAEIQKYSTLEHNIPHLQILFKDNGIGFDHASKENIFNIFTRLHKQSEYSGTGIGLALCRKITDNHKGIIFAQSQKNQGSTFSILLPLIQNQNDPT